MVWVGLHGSRGMGQAGYISALMRPFYANRNSLPAGGCNTADFVDSTGRPFPCSHHDLTPGSSVLDMALKIAPKRLLRLVPHVEEEPLLLKMILWFGAHLNEHRQDPRPLI